jgi:dCTP deaminase
MIEPFVEGESRLGVRSRSGGSYGYSNSPVEICMGVLSDAQIRQLAQQTGMIEPFVEGESRPGVISYGVSSYGYDVRLSNKFKIFTNVYGAIVDPKNFDASAFVSFEGDKCVIPPNSFVLAESYETIRVPRDILVVCLGKSTLARCGLIVNVTPLEPEWQGKITIEISNTTPLPAVIYANEGIAQLLFLEASKTYEACLDSNNGIAEFHLKETVHTCEVSYADKKGRYQNQKGLTLPFVSKGT